MIRSISLGVWLATVLPMAALLAWLRPALSVRWQRSTGGIRWGLVGLWLLGAGFLLLLPHDDSYTGLDNMTYRHLSYAFLDGRGFHDPDTVLAEVPEALREDFLLSRGPMGRPTRDRVFELADWRSVDTQPFFMPTVSLAAAAQAPVLTPEQFVPLMGALWLAIILATGFCAGGGWGLVVSAALILGTAWPAFFLRGFYSEGVGAMLISSVVAVSAIRPLRGSLAAVAGVALGLSLSYHPTMVILAVPVGLVLMLECRDGRTVAAWTGGMMVGGFLFWALTRWVCQPYGDWTRWDQLEPLIFLVPEHRVIALMVSLIAVISIVALCAGFRPAVRDRLRRLDVLARPWGWLAAYVIPVVLIVILPEGSNDALRKGATATWSGIRWPYAILFWIGTGLVLRKERPIRERVFLVVLCWAALCFLFIKGVETPVGLWSQRRFLPVILMGIGLLVAPISAGFAALSGKGRKTLVLILALCAGGANMVRWPVAYSMVNEQGAAQWVREVAEQVGPMRWVIFDYYGHSVPYAAGLQHRVLGLGEPSRERWPEVADWIEKLAQTQEVWVVTSWAPCTLEQGVRLESVFQKEGQFPTARAKAFFPTVKSKRTVKNNFMRAVPLSPDAKASQTKQLDESPVGLRGPWGRAKDSGGGRMARWSRQGSGIIGPVPDPGGTVLIQIECAFMGIAPDWQEQTLTVQPPWKGDPASVVIREGWQTVEVELTRPSVEMGNLRTGIYALSVERVYSPAQYGVMGYSDDLGVQIRQIIIRIEADAPFMPD